MIQKFVERFEARKAELEARFKEKHPEDYNEIVAAVVSILYDEDDDDSPDPNRIHEIDDGDYQGTLLYAIASKDYQPSTYYLVFIGYGSCSGCDTLEEIRSYGDQQPTDEQVKHYLNEALHVVQGLKRFSAYAKEA